MIYELKSIDSYMYCMHSCHFIFSLSPFIQSIKWYCIHVLHRKYCQLTTSKAKWIKSGFGLIETDIVNVIWYRSFIFAYFISSFSSKIYDEIELKTKLKSQIDFRNDFELLSQCELRKIGIKTVDMSANKSMTRTAVASRSFNWIKYVIPRLELKILELIISVWGRIEWTRVHCAVCRRIDLFDKRNEIFFTLLLLIATRVSVCFSFSFLCVLLLFFSLVTSFHLISSFRSLLHALSVLFLSSYRSQ